jgi:hypothetical protein
MTDRAQRPVGCLIRAASEPACAIVDFMNFEADGATADSVDKRDATRRVSIAVMDCWPAIHPPRPALVPQPGH